MADTKPIRLLFCDFWPDFNRNDNFFTRLLKKYDKDNKIEFVTKDPNIIIFTIFGTGHKIYMGRKDIRFVLYLGENYRPFDWVDANLTFDHTTRYNNIRLPLFILNGGVEKIRFKKHYNRFCCYVASSEQKHRNDFCKELSKYKDIDCGGKCLNNVGGKVKDKISFQMNHKFAIAFENSGHPGYCTEKIVDAYKSNCVPIYWGSTTVKEDFNEETFICAHDFNNTTELIKYIKEVDNDPDLYDSFFTKPILTDYWLDIFADPDEKYFKSIALVICPDLF